MDSQSIRQQNLRSDTMNVPGVPAHAQPRLQLLIARRGRGQRLFACGPRGHCDGGARSEGEGDREKYRSRAAAATKRWPTMRWHSSTGYLIHRPQASLKQLRQQTYGWDTTPSTRKPNGRAAPTFVTAKPNGRTASTFVTAKPNGRAAPTLHTAEPN